MTMGMGDYLWRQSRTQAAAEASGNSGPLDTKRISAAALDITIATITGGTDPTVTFSVERLGGDDIWYPVAASAAQTAAGVVSLSISSSVADGADAQHAVFTDAARVVWTFGGTAPPTSVKFSGSFYGRE